MLLLFVLYLVAIVWLTRLQVDIVVLKDWGIASTLLRGARRDALHVQQLVALPA